MERSSPSRKRDHPTSPVRPPIRIPRDKRASPERPRPGQAGRLRAAKDNNENIRVARRSLIGLQEGGHARHFTVGNVGADGTLYLKPSRAPANRLQTPPSSSDGSNKSPSKEQYGLPGNGSGTGTRRPRASRNQSVDSGIPIPPLSLHNATNRRRPRSHSFTTLTDHARSRIFEPNDLQILVNGKETSPQRPKSSLDLSAGLRDFQIPHYQLGTPRFSEYGTAYLHNSIYTSASDDGRSSVFLGSEYDHMFPAPPGRASLTVDFLTRNSTTPPFLHPSMAVRPKSAARSATSSLPVETRITALYDEIDADPNDVSCVRYNPSTGRIAAATPARLIAQITSAHFLDYELLSDFFLTYRNFLTSSELLEYLLGRLAWALSSVNDSGRIVRVRTFVALRHWILNYFADDFVPNHDLRQRFCDLVNDLTEQLRHKSNGGGTDMSIIGELKKCWRRTCAVIWPGMDYMASSLESDLFPSGEPDPSDYRMQTPNSAPPGIQSPESDKGQPFTVKWSDDQAIGMQRDTYGTHSSRRDTEVMTFRTTSIPTSPMSEQSLQVLSCSVPFLRNIGATAKKGEQAIMRSLTTQKTLPPLEKSRHPSGLHQHKPSGSNHQHKRSGSFSDALRDKRSPLPAAKVNNLDLQSLPVIAFTGGLVRGLLLQPSPSEVDAPVSLSPALVPRNPRLQTLDEDHPTERPAQHAGVKRIVGDVRRVFSGRKGEQDLGSPGQRSVSDTKTYHSSQPSNVSKMTKSSHSPKPSQTTISAPLQSLQRIDVLGSRIQASYKSAYEQISPALTQTEKFDSLVSPRSRHLSDDEDDGKAYKSSPKLGRWNSHLTTGSRSIVIVDDTGISDTFLPTIRSSSPPDFLFLDPEKLMHGDPIEEGYANRALPEVPDDDDLSNSMRRSSSKPMHDLLGSPHEWNDELITNMDRLTLVPTPEANARKSSTANPIGLVDISPIRGQLRRRPGGDLKAADHVHELEPTPRPGTSSSFSTPTQSVRASAIISHDLANSIVPHSDTESWPLRSDRVRSRRQVSARPMATHISQPNTTGSFEAQALKVASLLSKSQDGGIEDALMKLEGRSPAESIAEEPTGTEEADLPIVFRQAPGQGPTSTRSPSDLPSEDSHVELDSAPIPKIHGESEEPEEYVRLESMTSCTDTLEPIPPTLPRGSKISKFPIYNADADELSSLISMDDDLTSKADTAKHESKDKHSYLSIPSKHSATYEGSFLLDDNESLSDISTEIASQLDGEDDGLGMRSFFFDDTLDDDDTDSIHAPPTPRSTISLNGRFSPDRKLAPPSPHRKGGHLLKEAASPPRNLAPPLDHDLMVQPQDLMRAGAMSPTSLLTPAHLPFILAFDAETIAQQLTIIEKDALDEVDWKDLIAMNWQQSAPSVRNWVDHLQNEESNGIDIVVARFNLVVKWVVSECILTESAYERARCITKFIHIASQCHRMRNYASMYQVTLALLSSDLARLHKTWALVPQGDKEILYKLESLCQPLRNFANLRAEMESSTVDAGCIPFIGLYTHDLMYNAQKPAKLDPTPPSTEPLINFERYQTAAKIVKSLLRLIEASSRYVFHPHPVALSRCLWLAALEDKEISVIGRRLE